MAFGFEVTVRDVNYNSVSIRMSDRERKACLNLCVWSIMLLVTIILFLITIMYYFAGAPGLVSLLFDSTSFHFFGL